ncbi:DUF732 domain-containing protein [Mycobacterium heidelbergense]|uniref:Uncharacterized protein n=1 Tax=Mycobacterium heidelbergense TaxID=53376 RepID=A0A1X0D9K1_MYCHE|nr:DUF732 domain-containing protein [Mycobacterium heidelbergense]MCV7051864.1 DUF732 domain-containing protein [Mycobacterium heidelbergense]ORA69084.1 hypothetical protein BST25_21430 [Mycobacterium heidelbergense]BBZ49842.1 hypothetical protein MHEI_15590 [Mycobacterium heidelbergense]
MAAPTRYGQFVGSALVGGPLLVAGIVLASPARADATAYLNDLHNVGIHDVGGGDQALLQTGLKLCTQLSYGATPQQLRDLALQRSDGALGSNGLTVQQADDLINYARIDLCP